MAQPGVANKAFGIKQSWSLTSHTQTMIMHLHTKKVRLQNKQRKHGQCFYRIILRRTPVSKATKEKTDQLNYKNIKAVMCQKYHAKSQRKKHSVGEFNGQQLKQRIAEAKDCYGMKDEL